MIQRTLAQEMSFSGPDDSQELSGELVSDEEPGPRGLPCDRCKHFLHAEYVRARSHKALLERVMAESGQLGLGDMALPQIRDCCIAFYAKWL